jgi:hypothetical protein
MALYQAVSVTVGVQTRQTATLTRQAGIGRSSHITVHLKRETLTLQRVRCWA